VTAELGRVTMPISAILGLGISSVVELSREVSEPIDLVVQGVRMARGEVVVVGDCFAVRIKEIIDPKKRG
jgi:flagellar motor switch protein FliN/FliY